MSLYDTTVTGRPVSSVDGSVDPTYGAAVTFSAAWEQHDRIVESADGTLAKSTRKLETDDSSVESLDVFWGPDDDTSDMDKGRVVRKRAAASFGAGKVYELWLA